MFAIPKAFSDALYFQGVDRTLWYIAAIVTYISGLIFLIRMKQVEAQTSKQWYFAFFLFSFCYATTRIFFNLAVDFALLDATACSPDPVTGNIASTDPCLAIYNFWVGLGYVAAMPGTIALIYVVEKNLITNTKKAITITLTIGLIVAIFGVIGLYGRDISLVVTYVVSLLATIMILLIYIFMIRHTTGSIRKKTVGAFIGIIIWFVSIVLDGEVAYSVIVGMPLILNPLLYFIGVALYTIFQRAS